MTIEKLAPTGEGVCRDAHGVGFVARSLPGEDVDAEVTEERRRHWKGRAVAIHCASDARVTGPHAACAGCDWGHFQDAAARAAKRELFLETMQRIGGLTPGMFGELAIVPSPPRYRLRNRFHVSRSGDQVEIGYFAPRSHRVESAAACQTPAEALIGSLPRIADAIGRSRVPVREVATIEDREGVERLASFAVDPGGTGDVAALALAIEPLFAGWRIVAADGSVLQSGGQSRVTMRIATHELLADLDAFFQTNRFLVETLFEEVRVLATGSSGAALDAYGGIGLFALALLGAGLDPVTVEPSEPAVALAREGRRRGGFQDRWKIVRSDTARFLASDSRRFEVAVVDPPRGGVGSGNARQLAARTASKIVVVSCDPATLARDLPVLLSAGWRIAHAKLFDLFAFTHRVESVVALEPAS